MHVSVVRKKIKEDLVIWIKKEKYFFFSKKKDVAFSNTKMRNQPVVIGSFGHLL